MKKVLNLKLSKEELIIFQINLLLNGDNILNKTDIQCLMLLFLYGYKKGKHEFEIRKITLNHAVWANKMNKFRKMKIIENDGINIKFNDNIKFYNNLKTLIINVND
jgi:hypothetical protein